MEKQLDELREQLCLAHEECTATAKKLEQSIEFISNLALEIRNAD